MFKATKIVYLVRHGQSEANTRPVFQPSDSPLTALGQRQAGMIAERASKLPFEALIASPLPRARSTAEAIGKLKGIDPEFSDLFVERIKPSKTMGKSFANIPAMQLWRKWEPTLYMPGEERVEDGENFDDFIGRTDQALSYLRKRKERQLLVVTHGLFLRAIMARVLLREDLTGPGLRSFLTHSLTENTGITVLKYGHHLGGKAWRLWTFNDHAHLG